MSNQEQPVSKGVNGDLVKHRSQLFCSVVTLNSYLVYN